MNLCGHEPFDGAGGFLMPMFVGALAALIALAAGILAQVDAIACVYRAALAFVLGWIGASVWQVVCTGSMRTIAVSPELGEVATEEPAASKTSDAA